MTLGALSLGPADACYDPAHPWYYPNFMNTDAECQCMAAHPSDYTCGQQCVGYSPDGCDVASVMAGQAGAVVGAGANAVGEGIGSGVASGLSNFAASVDFSGLMLLGVAGVIAYALLSKR